MTQPFECPHEHDYHLIREGHQWQDPTTGQAEDDWQEKVICFLCGAEKPEAPASPLEPDDYLPI